MGRDTWHLALGTWHLALSDDWRTHGPGAWWARGAGDGGEQGDRGVDRGWAGSGGLPGGDLRAGRGGVARDGDADRRGRCRGAAARRGPDGGGRGRAGGGRDNRALWAGRYPGE